MSRIALVLACVSTLTTAVTLPAEAADCSAGTVALTFDDGPNTVHTPRILDILAKHDVPATFFVAGRLVTSRPAIVQRQAREGHAVANHTNGHERLTSLSDAAVVRTVELTDQAVRGVGVTPLPLVRPPYGATSVRVRAALNAAGYNHILWDIDPRDWEAQAALIRSRVLHHLRDGAVILLHDGSSNSLQTRTALPGIIDGARSRGYCFGLLDARGRVIRGSGASTAAQTPSPAVARPAIVRGDTWHLRSRLSGGAATTVFTFGQTGDVALMCDVSGDGRANPVVVSGSRWHIRDRGGGSSVVRSFTYGRAGDIPICGDWNGDGRATPGVVRDGRWLLRDRLSGGAADRDIRYGRPGDLPIVGDWTGNGRDGVGVVRGGTWHLRDTASSGTAHRTFTYGRRGDVPVGGDWTGNGRDGVGVVRDGTWHLRDTASGGAANRSFTYGRPGDVPLTW